MSDDPRTNGAEQPRPIPTGIIEHYCEHPGCKRWGGWGFPRGKETVWFCYEHRPEE